MVLLSTLFISTSILVQGIITPENALAGGLPVDEGEWGDGSWTVKEQLGRIFYYTHGMAVYGHEFGFYKDPKAPEMDMLWLTFSSINEKVKDFEGQEVTVMLVIDGVSSILKLNLPTTMTMGHTHIMFFENWVADSTLIAALTGDNVYR